MRQKMNIPSMAGMVLLGVLSAILLGTSLHTALGLGSTVSTQPSTQPTAQPTAQFGENMGGIGDSAADTSLHPQLLTAAKALNLSYVRLWLEGGWEKQQPADYWKISHQWKGAVYCCANFQNSVPRCSAPSDGQWTAYWTTFPPPAVTGIYCIQIGNEVNTSAYYNGTPDQLAHLMQLAYPILHAKGYVVEAGSDLNDLTYYAKLDALGAFAWCDRIDVHAYYSNADQVVAQIDKGIAFGKRINKPCDASEFNVRMSASNAPVWAAESGAALVMLKARSGVFLPFPFFPIATDPIDRACPLNGQYEHNEPFWSAAVGALSGASAQ